MKDVRRNVLVAALAAIAVASVSLAATRAPGAAPPAARAFKPARIAVLDVSRLFGSYNKTKDLAGKFRSEFAEAEKKRREAQGALKGVLDDLKDVKPGTPRHRELYLKSKDLEYTVKEMEGDLDARMQMRRLELLKEIRLDFSADVEKYAADVGLDLVIEKSIVLDTDDEGKPRLTLPIVHYARPEVDITDEVVARLNTVYGPPRTARP